MVIIAIDPGRGGAIARLNGAKLTVVPMPPTERDCWDAIVELRTGYECRGVIEQVHSMPRQGVVSTFKFGVQYGSMRMALVAAKIPFIEVSPRRWQKLLSVSPRRKGEPASALKNRLKAMAQQLYPTHRITLITADAILLATVGRQLWRS